MKKRSFLIVGGGLAGLSLAYSLQKKGARVVVCDNAIHNSASRTAAGIISPVTGRRLAKSWMADELIPFAEGFYREVERASGRRFFFGKPILEIFSSVKNKNDWMARSAGQGFDRYIGEMVKPRDIDAPVRAPLGGILLRQTGYLQVPVFLEAVAMWLGDSYRKHTLLPGELNFNGHVTWNGQQFANVIFCCGYHAAASRYFKSLPFLPVKGELLTIRCPDVSDAFIINQGMFMLPLGDGFFRVGATYAWDFKDSLPTRAAREKIELFLQKILKVKYSVVAHDAAIRPAIEGRRPVLGAHPGNGALCIFNGLGAKGVMLAPYFADQLANFLTVQAPLPVETDIKRYSRRLSQGL